MPDSLPRAIAPEDVQSLLSVIDKARDRMMVLMLLRTGMRIGELLALRIQDIDLSEQKVMIFEAQKTRVGRVVYFSSDAKEALLAWLEEKDPREDVLFYGKKYETITYAAVRTGVCQISEEGRASAQGLHDPLSAAHVCERTLSMLE